MQTENAKERNKCYNHTGVKADCASSNSYEIAVILSALALSTWITAPTTLPVKEMYSAILNVLLIDLLHAAVRGAIC